MEQPQFKPWRVPPTTIREKVLDAWKDLNAGVKELITFGALTATLLGAGMAHEYVWKNHTETGREWTRNVETRYEELKQDPSLSDYDRTAKIVSEFYGLR